MALSIWENLFPVLVLFIGGGLDLVETKVISARAYKWFFEGDFTGDQDSANDAVEIVADDFECSTTL